MSETRRQLFKASVVSAIGVASGAALAGCTGRLGFGFGPNNNSQPEVIMGRDSSTPPKWYIFHFSSDLGTYLVYIFKKTGGAPGISPAAVPFDTLSWYQTYTNELMQMNNTVAVTITVGGTPLTIDKGGVLDPKSIPDLIKNAPAVPGSWNEIGKA